MTSDNTCIGCFQLENENPMCEHPAHQVNVSRIEILCESDSSKFFGTPCIVDGLTLIFNGLKIGKLGFQIQYLALDT